MVKEVATRTSDQAGDGTTTATVLAQAIVREGVKAVAPGMNPTNLRRGIDMAVASVVSDLAKGSKKISTNAEIAQIGTISANDDREIGEMIAQAMQKVGNEGVITIEEATSLVTELDIVEGMQFDRGYLSPYFVTNAEKMICELEKPYILLFEKKLSGLQAILPVLEAVVQSGNPLLIVAEDIEGEALATLVVNNCARPQGRSRQGPGFGDRRKSMPGGPCRRDRRSGDQRGSRHQAGERHARYARHRQEGAHRQGQHDDHRRRRQESGHRRPLHAAAGADRGDGFGVRQGKIAGAPCEIGGGVAIIRVGGSTEVEVKERKDRVDDAMHATRAAVEEGVVAGGGVTLLYASQGLGRLNPQNDDQKVGIDIVRRALQAPARQIFENAGAEGSIIVGKLLEGRGQSRLRRAERHLRRHGEGRHHRPDQGRASRPQGAPRLPGCSSRPRRWSPTSSKPARRQCRVGWTTAAIRSGLPHRP